MRVRCEWRGSLSPLSLCVWFVAISLVRHHLSVGAAEDASLLAERWSRRVSSGGANASGGFGLLHRERRSVHRQPRKRLHRLRALAADAGSVAVLVLACNRVTVRLCLDALLAHRPSARRFPVIVSQDCGHAPTAAVIASYGPRVTSMRPPYADEDAGRRGYPHIARHYRWALDETFVRFRFRSAVVVEDDLVAASDFFEYFQATLPLLRRDPTLMCVSAWNDNGKARLVDADAPALLHRTDFFPGLGWLLTAELWAELSPKWPLDLWDDWLRRPEQRGGRACIRPEVSRTSNFGRDGVSRGALYDQHIGRVVLNTQFTRFTSMDLSYLLKDNFDATFLREVYDSPTVTRRELQGRVPWEGSVRVPYYSEGAFERCAAALELMGGRSSGVPRTAYRGVVSFMHGGRRVYLAPNANWRGYGEDDNATAQRSSSFWLGTNDFSNHTSQ